MGRGRAKAKQTRVARELKYHSPNTDLAALQRELSGGTPRSGPVDDAEYDGVLGDVLHRIRQEDRAGRDLERADEMREVDDRALRRDPAHHGVTQPDPLVAETEVAQEDDRARGRHRREACAPGRADARPLGVRLHVGHQLSAWSARTLSPTTLHRVQVSP